MKKKRIAVILFCIMLLSLAALFHFRPVGMPVEEEQSPVTGLVANNGKPVEGARVKLYSLQDPSWRKISITDKKGFFSFDYLPYPDSEYIIEVFEYIDFTTNIGSVIFKADDKPVYAEIPVNKPVKVSGVLKDKNGEIFEDVYMVFRNDKHAFISETSYEGKFGNLVLPNQKYTIYSHSPGMDNNEFIEIAEITVGDSDIKDNVIYSSVPVRFPYIRNISPSTDGCYPGGMIKAEVDAAGYGLKYEWSCTSGEIIGEGSSITWVAPQGYGPYTIHLKITDENGATIEKDFRYTVYSDILTGGAPDKEVLDPLEDKDDDDMPDQRELEIGTSPRSSDTDDDGLSDAKELEIGTNPRINDTDGDSVYDGAELALGTDPLAADIEEGRRFVVRKEIGGNPSASVEMTGEGNVFYNTLSLSDNPLFFSFGCMTGAPLLLTSNEPLDRAVIKIGYDEKDLAKKGIRENELKIFKYKSLDKMFAQVVNSTVDVSGNTVIAEDDSAFGYKTYYIAASSELQTGKQCEFDVVFALDMTKDMQSYDAGFVCREGLKNLTEYIPDGSSISIIRSSPQIEIIESASKDKQAVQYRLDDITYRTSPGYSDLCSLIDKGIEMLSKGSRSKGKVLYILSASYNSTDQDMLLKKLKSARNEGITVYLTGETYVSADIRIFLQNGFGRISNASVSAIYDLSIGEIINDFRSFNTLE